MSEHRNPWTTLSSRTVYENPWIRVVEDQVITPTGKPGTYGVVRYPVPGCSILPFDLDGSAYIVGQHRYAIGRYSWELPAGSMDADSDPLVAAQRELAEEAGLTAQHWRPLSLVEPVPSITNLAVWGYLAWDLAAGTPHPDDEEEIAVRRVPFGEVLEMALTGAMTNPVSIAIVLQAHVLALRGQLPPEVTPALRAGH